MSRTEEKDARKFEVVDVTQYPSIMATSAKGELSEKYSFIPTTKVIDMLAESNWHPTSVQEAEAGRAHHGYQKHLIRFRNPDFPEISLGGKDALAPEIAMVNSHNGKAAYKFFGGLFRFICSNGLISAESMFASFDIRHVGMSSRMVDVATDKMLAAMPLFGERIGNYADINLSKSERETFGKAALMLRYGADKEVLERYDVNALLAANRSEDDHRTLWHTLNTVQEKLVQRGGDFRAERAAVPVASGLSNIQRVVRTNQGLWAMADRMVELKKAA